MGIICVVRRLFAAMVIAVGLAAVPALACDVVTPSTADVGAYSPAAVATAAAPYVMTTGSFACASSSLLTLLGGDSLKATVAAGTVFTLTSTAGGTATYTPAADAAGTLPFTPGTTRTYINGTLLTIADSTRMAPPIYIKPQSATTLAPGVYRGSFVIKWDWNFCTQLNVLALCIANTRDIGSKNATVNVVLTVVDRSATVSITSKTTWEASASTNNPKAIPGSKLRLTMTIANPDIVPLDLDTLALTLATPAGLRIALDGDGTGSGAVVQAGDTTGATNLSFTYTSPSSSSDDVDFSSGGANWSYAPVAGDPVTQGMVTAVRFRPRGRMAAGSSYTISIPYSVK